MKTKNLFLLSALIIYLGLIPSGRVTAQTYTDLKGNWLATWNIDGTNTLRYYLKISKSGTTYSGAMDDLDSGYNNMPAVSISNSPPNVRFDFSNIGFVFQGVMNSNYTQVTGTWTNGSQSWPLVFEHEPSVDELEARVYSDVNGSLPYRLFVPPSYSPAQPLPLVVHLHGAGERGSDNRLQLAGQTGSLLFLVNSNQAKQPCFFAAPQCPAGGSWVDIRRPQVVGLIAALKAEFNIDADRVYVTGLSLGGAGTWELLALNGNLFAAGIPMSGYPGTLTASATAAACYQIPIWNFHAVDDATVGIANSRSLIGGIRFLGGTPIYTEFATGNHPIWSASYGSPLLYDWMVAQKRGALSSSNTPPFVKITSPNDQPFFTLTNTNATPLAGVAGNIIAGISSISWANNRGGGGAVVGTTNWSITNVVLQTGTNLITVTATGTSWITSYGGQTTFSDVARIQPTGIVPPGFLTQPTNVTIVAGASAPFSVIAVGEAPLTYQWRMNGANIAGATNSSYIRYNAQVTNAGNYDVILASVSGSVTSAIATLAVLPAPPELFRDDFDSFGSPSIVTSAATTNGYKILFNAASGGSDFKAIFGFDYSAVTHPIAIPPSPHSTGTSKGLYLTVNKADATAQATAVNLYPLSQSFTGNFSLKFDMWINWTNAATATEHTLFGINHSGNVMNRVGLAGSDGLFFAMDGDGGSSASSTTLRDFSIFRGAGGGIPILVTSATFGPAPLLGTQFDSSNPGFTTLFPAKSIYGGTPGGSAGMEWNSVEIRQENSLITWLLNDVAVAQFSSTQFGSPSVPSSGTFLIGYNDNFGSIGDTNNFVILDNVRVESVATLPIQLLSPHIVGNHFGFSFAADPYASYTVKYSTNVATQNWITYTNVLATGNLVELLTPRAGKDQQYFRVSRP